MGKQQNQPQNQPKKNKLNNGNAKDLLKINIYFWIFVFWPCTRWNHLLLYAVKENNEVNPDMSDPQQELTQTHTHIHVTIIRQSPHKYIQTNARFTQAVYLSLDYKPC